MTLSHDDTSYDEALSALFGPIHNQVTTRQAMEAAQARRHWTVREMREYARRLSTSTTTTRSSTTRSSTTTSSASPDSASSDATKEPINIMPQPHQRIFHIAGTKGKGSTAAMCEALCRNSRHNHQEDEDKSTITTGLFTSPHLCDIRERIRINGRPVSKQVFAQAYWRIRRKLEAWAEEHNKNDNDNKNENDNNSDSDYQLPILPGYFRMLTLMALHIFANYQNPTVDVMILEVGMGGRYDATNLIDHAITTQNQQPDAFSSATAVSCCGVTLIDYDHIRILGKTLEEIAWYKGGIFLRDKVDRAYFSPRPNAPEPHVNDHKDSSRPEEQQQQQPTDQVFFALETNTPAVIDVLQRCAHTEGRGARLQLVGPNSLPAELRACIPPHIGLAGPHQRDNAHLAVALVAQWLRPANPTAWRKALETVSWPARCQTIQASPSCTIRVDGAHTEQSLQVGLEWFQEAAAASSKQALIFFCSHEKNPVKLLQILMTGSVFDTVLFCRPNSERPSPIPKKTAGELLKESGYDDDAIGVVPSTVTWEETLKEIWQFLSSAKTTLVSATEQETISSPTEQFVSSSMDVAQALKYLQEQQQQGEDASSVEVFATGSLYLAGSVLDAVHWTEEDAPGELASPVD